MNKNGVTSSLTAMLCILITATGALLPGGSAWGVAGPPIAVPPPTLVPLNQIAVPEPPNLFQFVKNKPAAIKLGKAFFWDMQVGSDAVQACASCHFSAGADNRRKNTINPGTRGGDTTFQVRGPNDVLLDTDFPFHQRDLPDLQASAIIRNFNDIVGSQGVTLTDFVAINNTGSAVDVGTPVADAVFHTGVANTANNTRRVTARNTPSNINAIFNFSNFWDGRAHFQFNGNNPFGPLDPSAGIWFNTGTVAAPVLTKQKVAIEFASLASQATGPPLDDTEMSFSGRTFPQLGRKMLDPALIPLGKQFVHPNDSVLGPLSLATILPGGKLGGSPGLSSKYSQMIMDAFQDNLWNAPVTTTVSLPTKATPLGEPFTQMEANFSFYWGLAIQLYEATLVSDQTPFDRFLGGDQAALTPAQQNGFNLFFGAGGCSACHAGTELTNASFRAAAFVTIATNALIEQMPVALNNQQVIYDSGFNNTSVTLTTDDIGRAGNAPFTNPLTNLPFPLSFSLMAELQATNSLPFVTSPLPANLAVNFPVGNNGGFKIPGLRNVELTAPYMHNGGMLTLDQVVDFYTRGGNFPTQNAASLDVAITQIGALQNNPTAQANLVAFMLSFTDPRVKNESAPFDHPELFVPNGDPANPAPNALLRIPARDATGTQGIPSNFKITQVATPTNVASQLIKGTVDVNSTVTVSVTNTTAGINIPPAAATVTGTNWSFNLSGLGEGVNTVKIASVDPQLIQTTLTQDVVLDTVPPALTVASVTTPTRGESQLISGTVEAGISPVVTVGTTAKVGPVTLNGTSWSCQLTQLATGPNAITVTAVDAAGNPSTQSASIVLLPDGIFNGTKVPDISDALRALRIAVGLISPTADDFAHGDVAPLDAPDGKLDVADALLIMRNVVGSISLRTN